MTGLPRYRLLDLVNHQLNDADKNHDGKISVDEWEKFIQSKRGLLFQRNSNLRGALQVVAYSPTYSCCPPPLFILTITALQIIAYVIR